MTRYLFPRLVPSQCTLLLPHEPIRAVNHTDHIFIPPLCRLWRNGKQMVVHGSGIFSSEMQRYFFIVSLLHCGAYRLSVCPEHRQDDDAQRWQRRN